MSDDEMDAGVEEEGRWTDATYGPVESGTTAPTVTYINESGLPDELVRSNLRENREISSIIEQWSQSLNPSNFTGAVDIFARNRWQNKTHTFAIMSQCAYAVENDDILSTLADVVEGLTFKKMRFEMNDDDQQDVWNQWAAEVDLDSRLREQFRDLFKVSQIYVGLWWDQRIYSVRDTPVESVVTEMQRLVDAKKAAQMDQMLSGDPTVAPPPIPQPAVGPGKGNRKRKKKFAVQVPTAFHLFDPTKVMPVGTLMFGRERFAYIADAGEQDAFSAVMAGNAVDSTVLQLIESRYTPTTQDRVACGDVGVDPDRLWLFKQDAIYRHSLTRAQYERFAPVRLKSVLQILEMKQHLRASDRASLIGNTNFIVVVTKGSDKLPAKAAEIENLREQVRVVARLPILVGDHRLEVKIVAPPIDNTLAESRYQVLDSRLVFKALQSFQPIVQGGNATTAPSEMGRVVGQGLESRRHMLVRSLERFVFGVVMDRNVGVLDESPTLSFAPKRVTLDFSADVVNAILKLRDRGDVSRETTLDEFDYDQDVEVVRRAREKAFYDDTFQSGTPFSSPQTNPFAAGVTPLTLEAVPAATPEASPNPTKVAANGAQLNPGGRSAGVTETTPRTAKGTAKS